MPGIPWITHVTTADLDGDGRLDVLAAEGRLNQILWLRQRTDGTFDEDVLAADVRGPARIEPVDFNDDGRVDLLVACLGVVMPNNERIGAVLLLENLGQGQFRRHVLLENVMRVADVRAGDFNGNGRLDLVVAHFGYHEGEIRWMENLGDGTFRSHLLLELPGTIHTAVVDIDLNGTLDIVALVSQNAEEIYLFQNDGRGQFTPRVLWGSTNPDFGSSGIAVADITGNGYPDIAYTNGDGFDYATPGTRPWHGVQWLENLDGKRFVYHRLGDLPGAYSPVIADLNGDCRPDILAVSCDSDALTPDGITMTCFENIGGGKFLRRDLARRPTQMVVAHAADLNGNGQLELITGGLALFGVNERIQRITLWTRRERP